MKRNINKGMNKSMKRNKNSKHKSALSAVMIIVMMFSVVLAGCGGMAGQELKTSTAADTSALSSASAVPEVSVEQTAGAEPAASTLQEEAAVPKFPLKVTDAGGFEMTIQSEPQHIVSLTLGSDEILLGLVNKNRILALTKYAEDAGISNVSAEAAGVAERATMEQLESVIALKPDLVILDTWADAKYVKQLRDAGINVYAFKTPSNIEEQKTTIAEIANITGAAAKGQEILDWMDAKLNEVESKLAHLKPEEKRTVMDYGELGSSGKGTNFDDIVTRAGLINVISKAGMEGWPVISKEKIIEFNPEIIILPSWYYDQKNSLQGMKDSLKNDKSLQTVKAISDDRLISVPNPHISAISQYVVLAVEDVAKAAYPELFK